MKHDITGIPVKEIIRAFYEASKPFGMGMLHYREGSLSDEEIDKLIEAGGTSTMVALNGKDENLIVDLDYVLGRRVKIRIYKDNILEQTDFDEAYGQGMAAKILDTLRRIHGK